MARMHYIITPTCVYSCNCALLDNCSKQYLGNIWNGLFLNDLVLLSIVPECMYESQVPIISCFKLKTLDTPFISSMPMIQSALMSDLMRD